MGNNFFFFLGIFVFIFILWVITGGPGKDISFSGPYLKPINEPGETAEPYSLTRGYSGGSGITLGGTKGMSALEKQIGDLSSFGEASEYRGVVTIDRSPSGPRATDEESEYIRIDVSRRAAEPITLSGWRLESSASRIGAVIPGGVEIPRSGSVNTVAPIVITPGDTVIITSGRSPVGVSFRENICSGYLGEFQEFLPELSRACPTPAQELRRVGGDDDSQCLSYASRLPRCSVVSDAPSELSSSCENFLEDLNYNSCVADHRDRDDFRMNSWRIFLGADSELWRDAHETIRLIDASGKTVDVLAY